MGLGELMIRNGMRGRTRFVPIWGAIALSVMSAVALAQTDALEQSSVIPLGRSVESIRVGDLSVKILEPGNSSRKQREEALTQLPMRFLPPAAQGDVREVTNAISLYRRLPTVDLQADRRIYEFFTQHPDVAVSIWRAMNISQVQLWQTGPNEYETDTRDGTWGAVTVLHRSPHSSLVHCRGQFQSPALPRPVRAVALMHLQPRFHENGRVTHQVDLFVSFPSTTVDTIAKIVSPVSNRIADRNFEEISMFVEMMNLAMSHRPDWVEQISLRLDGVLPGRPEELMAVTKQVHLDAERHRQAQAGAPQSSQ